MAAAIDSRPIHRAMPASAVSGPPAAFEAAPLTHVGRRRSPYGVAKRALDVVAAAMLLLALTPLLLIVAALIRFSSPGPVLFRQVRMGQNGRPFEMLKFRTMIACRRRCERRASVRSGCSDRRRTHKSVSDPRVTTIGRILRRTSLDELPQLWNVLRGDMSLVGPRPELPEIVARYESWQHARHLARPGITGWWQVNRDGRRLMHEATEYDLYYLEHQSLALDLLILLRTVTVVLSGRGAF